MDTVLVISDRWYYQFIVIVTLSPFLSYQFDSIHWIETGVKQFVDIRVQQRSGRKTLTTIQGLPKQLDPKRVLKVFKKEFACNGTIVDDEEMGEIIQLQGDHRQKVGQILIEEGIAKKDDLQIHGF